MEETRVPAYIEEKGHIPSEACMLEARRIVYDEVHFAEVRTSEIADEFNKLEVQIATILLAFIGLFIPFLLPEKTEFAGDFLTMMKFFYAGAVVSLVGSLVMGLIHLKRKESFWLGIHNQKLVRLNKWVKILDGEDYLCGKAYMEGVAAGKPPVLHSPTWTWILQTILLGLGVVILLILFFILLSI